MKNHEEGMSLPFLLCILLFNMIIGGLATEYIIEFWVPFIKGSPVDVPLSLCMLAGIFVGEFTVPAALVTLIISCCI